MENIQIFFHWQSRFLMWMRYGIIFRMDVGGRSRMDARKRQGRTVEYKPDNAVPRSTVSGYVQKGFFYRAILSIFLNFLCFHVFNSDWIRECMWYMGLNFFFWGGGGGEDENGNANFIDCFCAWSALSNTRRILFQGMLFCGTSNFRGELEKRGGEGWRSKKGDTQENRLYGLLYNMWISLSF